LDRVTTSNASSNPINKQDVGKVFNVRRDQCDNIAGLEESIVEPMIEETDDQEICDGENEEYI
jgi:hypothetical protein